MIVVNIQRVPPQGLELRGEVSGDVLGIDEPTLKSEAPFSYKLKAELVGEGLLVKGTANASLRCVCDRCGEWFFKTLDDTEVCHFYEIQDQDEIDLTPDVREDILINLPQRIDCGCPDMPRMKDKEDDSKLVGLENAWSELNKLKFG